MDEILVEQPKRTFHDLERQGDDFRGSWQLRPGNDACMASFTNWNNTIHRVEGLSPVSVHRVNPMTIVDAPRINGDETSR